MGWIEAGTAMVRKNGKWEETKKMVYASTYTTTDFRCACGHWATNHYNNYVTSKGNSRGSCTACTCRRFVQDGDLEEREAAIRVLGEEYFA